MIRRSGDRARPVDVAAQGQNGRLLGELVQHRELTDIAAVQRWRRVRAPGRRRFVARAVCGSELHRDNVMACGGAFAPLSDPMHGGIYSFFLERIAPYRTDPARAATQNETCRARASMGVSSRARISSFMVTGVGYLAREKMGPRGGRGAWAAVVCAVALAAGGCGEQPPVPPVAHAVLGASPQPTDVAQARQALRQRFVQDQQLAARDDARYALIKGTADRELVGQNPDHRLSLSFGKARAGLRSTQGWQLALSAAELRCDERTVELPEPEPPIGDAENRALFRRSVAGQQFDEWYVNGPLGLEQGFTLGGSPCDETASALTIDVGVDGLTPKLETEQRGPDRHEVVRLVDGDDHVHALYSDWFAYDRDQRPLPLRVTTEQGRIRLRVDLTNAAFPVTIDPIVWAQQTKVSGPANSFLGNAIALDGNTALVAGQDGVYVYVSSGGVWAQQQKLGTWGASAALSLSGNTAVIGDPGANASDGAAYVYVRSGTTWTLQETFLGGYGPGSTPAQLGKSVAFSGDTLLVGVPSSFGHVRVFVRSGTTWTKQQELVAADTWLGVGFSVALSGNVALVGAASSAAVPGAVYMFERSGTVWTETQRFQPSDSADYDRFGYSLALSGNTLLVGARTLNVNTGSAYVFTRSGATWSQQQKLVPSAAGVQYHGSAVALLGDTALVGGWDEAGIETGFTWSRSGSVWTEQFELQPTDPQQNGHFAEAVALGPRLALLGSRGVESTEKRGAFYVFGSGLAKGDSCTAGSECITGYCVEGVCCDTTCQGTCKTCLGSRKASGPSGTCGDVKVGTDPLNQCATSAVSTCGLDGSCNGSGACQYHAAGSECAPASCPTSKSENHADTCNGSGTCVVTAAAACDEGYVCAAGNCNTSCDADGDCDQDGGYSCIGGECLIAKGSPCAPGDLCETGHCADGVCCDAACTGDCTACLMSLTGEPNGSCAVIPAGQDPQDECPADTGYPETCGADGACNGAGACREYAIAGTPCGAPTQCMNDAISGEVCNGTGTCTNDTVECGVYPCDAAMVACANSCETDEDCSAIAYCITGGTCAEKKADGTACSDARECGSGLCVDGVCCDSPCDGQCAGCAEPGSEGQCVAVTGAPRAGRSACAGSGDVCQGVCDGVDPMQCSYASETTVCARACVGVDEALGYCDGSGACQQSEPTSCGGYVCQGDRCLTECSRDEECQVGYGCLDGQCTPKDGRCVDGDTVSRSSSGQNIPCAPYLCNRETGACRTECESSGQCSASFACNPQTGTCEPSAASADDAGCACRAAGAPSRQRGSGALLLTGLACLWALRRARGRRALPALAGALALFGCSEGSPTLRASGDPNERPKPPAAAVSTTSDTLQAKRALRLTRIQDRQREARDDRRYALGELGKTARVTGHNPAFGMALSFGKAGVELTLDDDVRLGMSATTLRCDEQAYALDAAPAAPGTEANRVAYRRQANGRQLEEWYVNGPLGLEQGFTLPASPCASSANRLSIEMTLRGLATRLVAEELDGERREVVELLDARGRTRALYSDWFAYDASQRPLSVEVSTANGRLSLHTDISGAVFPVTIDPLIWTEKKKLIASDRVAASADYFGSSVALDGTTALVGAVADANYQGAAYVHVRTGATWSEQKKLTASDGAVNNWFGIAAGLSGNTAIVGSYQASGGGAAYVFVRSGNAWTEQKKLVASDAGPGKRFGSAVALAGDTAVVGASSGGAAYVFVRSGTTWTEQKKLVPSDPASAVSFGYSVALSGDTALVGDRDQAASGAAYVFVRSGTNWTEQKKLTASNAAAGDMFGASVALSGDTAIVGAPARSSMTGAAYVFVRSGTTWTEQKQLGATEPATNDAFGWSVALSGDTAVVGARGDESNTGAVYVFGRTGTAWSETKKLVASDGASLDNLGISVALSGDVVENRQYDVLAGAQYDDDGLGSAYVFGMAYENADACTKDEDCVSQHCVENVCCNTACSGTCKSCLATRKASGPDGVCGDVKVNTDPRNACAASDVGSCGFDGTCDGAGACKYHPAGAECDAATCPSATSENPADTCNGGGTCSVQNERPCSPGYLCAAGACKTSCSTDGDCDTAAGYQCTGDQCLLPLGLPCTPEDGCESGHCVDGVCCESACAGTCSACINDETGQPDGTCAFALGGRDPRDECEPDAEYPQSCREDGACDGQGACRNYAVSGTACGETSCAQGTVSGDICDGAGQCAQASEECAPYICAGDACSTSCTTDRDCNESVAYCINGTCNLKKADAAPCTESNECQSGACSDGVCCDRACDGQCEACGSDGACQLVSGEPRGVRAACAGAGSACAGTCDGVSGLECTYPAAGTECGRACADARATVSSCDGAGTCVEGNPMSCEEYVCGADRCLEQCAGDADCQDGFACRTSQCVPGGFECIEGDSKSQSNADGTVTTCAPYVCEPSSGTCLTICRSSTDCSDGYLCDAEAKSCQLPTAAPQEEGGCGCRMAGAGTGQRASWALWLLGLGLTLALRRLPAKRKALRRLRRRARTCR